MAADSPSTTSTSVERPGRALWRRGRKWACRSLSFLLGSTATTAAHGPNFAHGHVGVSDRLRHLQSGADVHGQQSRRIPSDEGRQPVSEQTTYGGYDWGNLGPTRPSLQRTWASVKETVILRRGAMCQRPVYAA
jgi:hypothetical protein